MLLLLRVESLGSKCVKLHTVAASNNRDPAPQSLYYCLFVPHGGDAGELDRSVSHIQHNANQEVATLPCIKVHDTIEISTYQFF